MQTWPAAENEAVCCWSLAVDCTDTYIACWLLCGGWQLRMTGDSVNAVSGVCNLQPKQCGPRCSKLMPWWTRRGPEFRLMGLEHRSLNLLEPFICNKQWTVTKCSSWSIHNRGTDRGT